MQSDAPSRVSFTSLTNAWIIYDSKNKLVLFFIICLFAINNEFRILFKPKVTNKIMDYNS